jgi:hypothetical protein
MNLQERHTIAPFRSTPKLTESGAAKFLLRHWINQPEWSDSIIRFSPISDAIDCVKVIGTDLT